MIKKSIFCTVFTLSNPVLAFEKPYFSDNQKVLKLIELKCPKVWCKKSNYFRFNKLTFNEKNNTITVLFQMVAQDFPLRIQNNRYFLSSIDQKNFQMNCTIKGYSDPQSVLTPNGALNKSFEKRLTDCILSLESRVASLSKVGKLAQGVFFDWN